ncbi:MAG: hypothetical protein ACREJN_20980 [Nitrospiraceae bacterium]
MNFRSSAIVNEDTSSEQRRFVQLLGDPVQIVTRFARFPLIFVLAALVAVALLVRT